MPPEADNLRQRKLNAFHQQDGHPAEETFERLCTLAHLKTTEVCIDGVVYSLEGFHHPGGDQIYVFGGNDVTVQYYMIHPYHTAHHLAKLKRVGKVVDYHNDYKFNTDFEREMKREVFKIVKRGREFGTLGWFFRCAIYVALFFYLQYQWAFQSISAGLAVLFGVSQALIGMNVQHDANHGACSKHPWINELLGFGADLIGGCKWLWQEQHWTHHSYTNHHERDPDSFGAEPLLLFNDYPKDHPARAWYHKFQVLLYAPVLAGYWLSAVFNPQVLDLRQRGALTVGIQMESEYLQSRRKYAGALRLLYIYLNVWCPFAHHGLTFRVLGLILLMGAAESLALAILFSLSHNFEKADRDPTARVRATGEPICWFKSQVETSATYGGMISGWFTGGLNFQIEHHLFPRMSSAWYPYIAPTVRRVCAKHGVRYVYYPWMYQNLISTVKYMHQAGTGSNWENNPLSGKL